jgi:hypothetical protein
MAVRRPDDPIEPMDLANMRANGARSLDVQCNQCRHRVIVNVDHLAGDLTVPSFGPRMVCTKCGTIGADVRPNWQEARRFSLVIRTSNPVLFSHVGSNPAPSDFFGNGEAERTQPL